jgi:hypothetical protein
MSPRRGQFNVLSADVGPQVAWKLRQIAKANGVKLSVVIRAALEAFVTRH